MEMARDLTSKARSPIIAFFFSHFLYFFLFNQILYLLKTINKLSSFKIQLKDKCDDDIFIFILLEWNIFMDYYFFIKK